MDYGRLVLENLKKKGFYDDVGQFDVTDEVRRSFILKVKTCRTNYDLIFFSKLNQLYRYLSR